MEKAARPVQVNRSGKVPATRAGTDAAVPAYSLGQSLPFLLNRVGVLQGELFGRELAVRNLTVPMYRVIASLAEVSGQRLGDLSASTSIELSTLSRLIGQMTSRRLVVRARQEDNARTVRIGLTVLGKSLARELIPRAQRYEQEALSVCTPAEVKVLRVALTKIYARLAAVEAGDAAPPPTRAGRLLD